MKARSMLGVGPITSEMKSSKDTTGKNKDTIRKELVSDLLCHQLDFNFEELELLDIKETTEGKDNIIYFAARGLDMLREIHIRKAERQERHPDGQELHPTSALQALYVHQWCV